jgi:hypothetical protein
MTTSTQHEEVIYMPAERKYVLYAHELLSQAKPDTQTIVAIGVTVTTGMVPKGGTDANVTFRIGAKPFLMDTPGYDDFERGETDTYYFATSDLTLGQLRKSRIELSHDNSGHRPGWYVANLILQVQFPDSPYMVPYKRWGNIGWLARDEGPYYTTSVELQLGQEV